MGNTVNPTSHASYEVLPISDPPTLSDIHGYREVRLTSLKTDPFSFSSTYEGEVAFSEETWRERLTGGSKASFLVRASGSSALDSDEDGGSGGSGGSGETEGRTNQVVGSMTAMAARNLPASRLPSGATQDHTYFIFGMWVHPEHRRRGLCKMLVDSGLRWIKEDRAGKHAEGSDGMLTEVWLAVTKTNNDAKMAYLALGFKDLGEHLDDDGHVWMRLVVQVE